MSLRRLICGRAWEGAPLTSWTIAPGEVPQVALPARVAARMLFDALGSSAKANVEWAIDPDAVEALSTGRRRQLGEDTQASEPKSKRLVRVKRATNQQRHVAFRLPSLAGYRTP